jgi:hypothetical protein
MNEKSNEFGRGLARRLETTVPASWAVVRIGDIAQPASGFAFPKAFQGQPDLAIPFVKVSDMNADGAEVNISTSAHKVDRQILSAIRARTYPPGTVIFPKVGAALLTNKRRILAVEAAFDNNVMGLVPNGVESAWLYLWLSTIDFRHIANGDGFPRPPHRRAGPCHLRRDVRRSSDEPKGVAGGNHRSTR